MIFWGEVLPDESRGSEQHHEERRPCPWVILSSNVLHRRLPVVLAAPLTSHVEKDEGFRNHRIRVLEAHVNKYALPQGEKGLSGDSLVLTEQLRVLAHTRLIGDPIAKVSLHVLASIEAGLRHVLEMP